MSLREMTKQYSLMMQKISQTKIADTIPLDIFLHALLGYIIYIIAKKILNNNVYLAFFAVLVLEVTKEIMDSFSLTNTLYENVTDFVATMIVPTILVIIKKKKNKNKTLN